MNSQKAISGNMPKNSIRVKNKKNKKRSRVYIVPLTPMGKLTMCKAPGLIAPDYIRVTLPFMEESNLLTLLAGIGQNLQYRGNSCFDPDFTGIGTDCNGFTQWVGLYNSYRVIGSRFIVRSVLAAVGGVLESNVEIATTAYTGTTAISTLVTLADVVGSPFGKVCYGNLYTGLCNLDTTLRTTDVWGKSPESIRADDNFAAASNANPVNVWCWQLSAFAPYNNVNVGFSVHILYDVEFFSRRQTTA